MTDPPQPEPTTPKKKGLNILVVEDDAFLVRAYEAMLLSQGHLVRVVGDGNAALEALKIDPLPSLILLDLMLPQKSGFEVLETIKKDIRLAHIPVIVLSNLGQPTDVERAQALGAADYFVKADTPLEKVVAAVKKHLPVAA